MTVDPYLQEIMSFITDCLPISDLTRSVWASLSSKPTSSHGGMQTLSDLWSGLLIGGLCGAHSMQARRLLDGFVCVAGSRIS